jgi:integrase
MRAASAFIFDGSRLRWIEPKSLLDEGRRHRLGQDVERATWGDGYSDHGLVFAREDGAPLPPRRVTKRFRELVAASGLRRVRLHDPRNGAASLRAAAGIDIAVVSKVLGHSSITLTVDTYSHLLESVGRDAADRASALVPRASRDQSATSRLWTVPTWPAYRTIPQVGRVGADGLEPPAPSL